MPTRIAGIQPGYLPWLGYFDQMRRVDAFIIADEMQFSSSGWAHHNRVRGAHGAHPLTLPARPTRGQRICDVPLDPTVPWARNHLTTLRHFYARSPFATEALAGLARVIERPAARMVDASIPVIHFLAERLQITTPLVVSSELGLERRYVEQFPNQPGPTHRIIAFMKALGARELLEGASGRAYLDVALCEEHGIRVEFHQYAHPIYRQLHEPFLSHLSAIDLLLCAGDEGARRVVQAIP
jgi:WbqC-like protein family